MDKQVLVNQMYIMDGVMAILRPDLDGAQTQELFKRIMDAREATHEFLIGNGVTNLDCAFGVDGTLFMDNIEDVENVKRVVVMNKTACKEFHEYKLQDNDKC